MQQKLLSDYIVTGDSLLSQKKGSLDCLAFNITCRKKNYRSQISRFIASNLKKSNVQFENMQRYGELTSSQVGSTAIRFDSQGVLFAIGSSSGLLRVFDFNECLRKLQTG